jgi:GNAT superfamily N-acetyltransferase
MNIEIKKLTSELTEDYLHFFDVTPHDDDVPGSKCYCVCWCGADHRIVTDFSSQEKRRELARQYVKDGIIKGYLAYQGNKVIGWCNANTKSECLHCTSWLRFMQSVDVDDTNLKIKSVFCFVIVPDMQRKGIATRLLCRVCEDAAADGFDVVESYPNKAFVSTTRDFMGPVEMYKKLGFTAIREVNDITVMRKVLK